MLEIQQEDQWVRSHEPQILAFFTGARTKKKPPKPAALKKGTIALKKRAGK